MATDMQNTSNALTNSFNKGMMKDPNDTFMGEGVWTHARNAVNNSHDGEIGVLGNEPANFKCADLPYPFNGAIHIDDAEWAVFSTDDVDSEIGVFNEEQCSYTKIVNDRSLGFKRSHLIRGVSRRKFDCGRPVYFSDGLNPDRYLDLDDVPWKQTVEKVEDCYVYTDTTELDVEKLRLAPLVKTPCLLLKKGVSSGTLPNGTYQVVIAYTVNQIKVTDYSLPTEPQSLFSHQNLSGSLELSITDMDTNFDEFELVVISYVNQQTVARKLGIYSTRQKTVYIDTIDPELPIVSISLVSQRSVAYERSDAMYQVNNYLLRSGIYSKFAFNYQPQANNIRSKWVAVKYPSNYYEKGGNNAGYLRDEQYSFFIRWVYNTGEKSASFHIPGRAPIVSDLTFATGSDVMEGTTTPTWKVTNTATITSLTQTTLEDGGVQVAEGEMGYWESTEIYPDNRPDIWANLCGKNIRHHKFPDNNISEQTNHFLDNGSHVVIMGVKFSGITHPLDNNGEPIASVVGYEILRGSREGHKSIIAKGILNNLREYKVPGSTTTTGLYQNYPFNDLRDDVYHVDSDRLFKNGGDNDKANPLKGYRKDMFSFHSPETSFSKPFLSATEVKIYSEFTGQVTGKFETPYKHPKFKLLNNKAGIAALAIGSAIAVTAALGKGNVSFGGSGDIPVKTDVAGGKMNLPAVGGALGTEAATTGINVGLIIAQAAIDIGLMLATSFIIADNIIKILNAVSPKQQHALQYVSHGFYNNQVAKKAGERRRALKDAIYVRDGINQFGSDFRINNVNRSGYVALQLDREITNPSAEDKTRVLVDDNTTPKSLYTDFTTTTSCHYGALKIAVASQYGQLNSIKQVPVSFCTHPSTATVAARMSTDVMFGGDTYINRFTEKNSMLFYTDWLLGQPDEYEYDYRNYLSIPYPRFYVDSTQENYQDLDLDLKVQSPIKVKLAPPSVKFQSPVKISLTLAQNKRHLNRLGKDGKIEIRNAYFYLFNSGVRDFFVESEINLAQRDWEEDIARRHYDVRSFTDLSLMFRSDIVKSDNYYKYDYSLSVSKLVNNYFSWGELLPSDYNPLVAEKCYMYYPSRVLYSLPQDTELKKDNWKIFLVNNYKDFSSRVNTIKSVNKTGALILFDTESPVQFMGVDQLQTDGGTKITIGDGGLFNQPLQSITNSDRAYQYGSCQNGTSVVATPQGVFWVSQEQGKIFQYQGQLNEISRNGNKWWFSRYLPSKLKEYFPNYDLLDNPIKGTGVMSVYDNTNEVVYFSKRDFIPLKDTIVYDLDKKKFYDKSGLISNEVELTNEDYFENVSWTLSYDIKNQLWISFHDWHPNYILPDKNHFVTVKGSGFWKHNERCDLFCNFYDKDYPFEVEFVTPSGQNVGTIRNVEYLLECFKYKANCQDRHHVLDFNFDRAIIYNSEQVSGVLGLNLKGKNNPGQLLTFPRVNNNSIDIHYAKEENKYRFNQFWDITKDRGEFSTTREVMFNTSENGYIKVINPKYINYNKPALEHKKFRHYANRVFLRKVVSADTKMLFKMINTKILNSSR
jgi:hypothetical protein